jgi:hypothetical protein
MADAKLSMIDNRLLVRSRHELADDHPQFSKPFASKGFSYREVKREAIGGYGKAEINDKPWKRRGEQHPKPPPSAKHQIERKVGTHHTKSARKKISSRHAQEARALHYGQSWLIVAKALESSRDIKSCPNDLKLIASARVQVGWHDTIQVFT